MGAAGAGRGGSAARRCGLRGAGSNRCRSVSERIGAGRAGRCVGPPRPVQAGRARPGERAPGARAAPGDCGTAAAPPDQRKHLRAHAQVALAAATQRERHERPAPYCAGWPFGAGAVDAGAAAVAAAAVHKRVCAAVPIICPRTSGIGGPP